MTLSVMSKANKRQVLSDEEYTRVVMALAYSRGRRGFTGTETEQVLRWAEETRIMATVLNTILAGELYLDINAQGEICFVAPTSLQPNS